MKRQTRYLNTDLDIYSPQRFQPLVDFLTWRGIFALNVHQDHSDNWFGTFETDEQYSHPEQNIAAMLSVIESLDGSLREQWLACTKRIFDVGYECAEEPWGYRQELSPALLARIAGAQASLRVTLYPDETASREERRKDYGHKSNVAEQDHFS